MAKKYRDNRNLVFQISGVPQKSYGFLKRLNFIFAVIDDNTANLKKYNVLDIGCGTGEYLTIPLGSLTNKIEVIGIDADARSIEYAKAINTHLNVHFECTRIDELDKTSQFDFIILSEVLEHLDNPKKMLNHINTLLKPDGTCFITIPNGFGPFEIENKIFKFLKQKGLINNLKNIIIFFQKIFKRNYKKIEPIKKDSLCEDPHIQFFTYKRFENLCSDVGLTIKYSANRTFLAGIFSDHIIDKSEILIDLNAKISDYLPKFAVSGWMFVVQKKNE